MSPEMENGKSFFPAYNALHTDTATFKGKIFLAESEKLTKHTQSA